MTELAGKIVSLIGRFAKLPDALVAQRSSGAAGSCGAGCRPYRAGRASPGQPEAARRWPLEAKLARAERIGARA